MSWEIKEYGSVVTDFFEYVGVGAEARILRDLRKLSSDGYKLRGKHTRSLGDGLRELRTAFDRNAYRLLYVFHEGEIVILHCFMKKTEKIKKQDLELASDRHKQLVEEEVKLGDVTLH